MKCTTIWPPLTILQNFSQYFSLHFSSQLYLPVVFEQYEHCLPQWSGGFCACHFTQRLRVQTWLPTTMYF